MGGARAQIVGQSDSSSYGCASESKRYRAASMVVQPSRDAFVRLGPLSPENNGRIFDKWFADPPSHFLAHALRRYRLEEKAVADVGSSYGHATVRFGPGSYGLELNSNCCAFANAVGIKTYQRDVSSEEISDLPPVDAIWCRDVLEHVDAPHVMLRKLWYLLKPDGMALFVVPLVTPMRHLARLPGGARLASYLAGDHVNFFTRRTMIETCRRAGYEVDKVTAALPIGDVGDVWPLIDLTPTALFVLRKVASWDYPAKAVRQAAPTPVGYAVRDDLYL